MSEIQTFIILPCSDGFLIVFKGYPIAEKDCQDGKVWVSEKSALQWLRRNAQRDLAKYEIVKADGTVLYMDYAPDPVFRIGKHKWQKVNVMALGDSIGPYDKLVCAYCHKTVKHYRRWRHFREEMEICEMNVIPVVPA